MVPRTLTPYQMSLLADIFRLILKEVKVDSDLEKLAPGELGISYTNGCFYVKNPYTGEIFTPNSLDHITQILSKYDEGTNILNADKISGFRVYTSLNQLPEVVINSSADTILEHMEYPSVLFIEIDNEYPSMYGFPGKHGLLSAIKLGPNLINATFYDYMTYINYECVYNYEQEQLKGWVPSGTRLSSEYCTTRNGGTAITIINDNLEVHDLVIISVLVSEDITTPATVNVNRTGALPIIDMEGNQITDQTILRNNIIMLIYDEVREGWILTDFTTSTVLSVIEIVNNRIRSLKTELDEFKAEVYSHFNS